MKTIGRRRLATTKKGTKYWWAVGYAAAVVRAKASNTSDAFWGHWRCPDVAIRKEGVGAKSADGRLLKSCRAWPTTAPWQTQGCSSRGWSSSPWSCRPEASAYSMMVCPQPRLAEPGELPPCLEGVSGRNRLRYCERLVARERRDGGTHRRKAQCCRI